MKKRYLALALAVLLLAALLLPGCGRSAKSDQSYSVTAGEAAYDYGPLPEGDYDMAPAAMAEEAYVDDYWAEPAMNAAVPMASAPVPAPAADQPSQENGPKLIYTADLTMETLEFDSAVTALARLTAEVGGYYEASSVSERGNHRAASYTVRVPAGQYRFFVDKAGSLCHMLSLNEYTEDVSESYYDTAGRLETQKTKLARLQQLLLQAEDMEDIITVESAISETEELIDRLSGTLRHYDALVDYSTVSVYLEEVRVYEPTPPETFGSRLASAFGDGLRGFAEGLGDILVALAYSWLWLLLIAGIVVLILWLTRKRRAAKKAERAERKARMAARKEELRSAPPAYSVPAEDEKEKEEP